MRRRWRFADRSFGTGSGPFRATLGRKLCVSHRAMFACGRLRPRKGTDFPRRRSGFGRFGGAGRGTKTGRPVESPRFVRATRTPRSARSMTGRSGRGGKWPVVTASGPGDGTARERRRRIAKGAAGYTVRGQIALASTGLHRLLGRRACLRGTLCAGCKTCAPGASISIDLQSHSANHKRFFQAGFFGLGYDGRHGRHHNAVPDL